MLEKQTATLKYNVNHKCVLVKRALNSENTTDK